MRIDFSDFKIQIEFIKLSQTIIDIFNRKKFSIFIDIDINSVIANV